MAIHQACQSLRLGESDLALVGSSQLVIHPDVLAISEFLGDLLEFSLFPVLDMLRTETY